MIDTTKATGVWDSIAKIFIYASDQKVIVTIIFVVLCVTLFIIITKPNLKIGNSFLSFDNLRRSGKDVPHKNCPHNIDFSYIVAKTSEIVTKNCRIDYIEIINIQMTYVEQKLKNVKSILLADYANLLSKKLHESISISAHEDYISYNRFVESMLREDIKDCIKTSFLSDEFSNLSNSEFEVFVDEKVEYLFQLGCEFIDMWYIGDRLISREELKDSIKLLKDKFTSIAFEVYKRAIDVSADKIKEKIQLRLELDTFFEKVVGIKQT